MFAGISNKVTKQERYLMTKKLVVVESPAKARTLGQFLGKDYTIAASVGHVRDLPAKELGVDVDRDFSPKYVVSLDKRKVVKEIRDKAAKATAVYLATDPDREGEAISWHLVQAANLDKTPLKRVVFHEITEEAIASAFRHPRAIDLRLVDAQQARRILDRLVGYKISPLLWKRVRKGLSAGRVQSVALKLIVDREAEILAFVPEEYWTIEAELAKEADKSAAFAAVLVGPVGEDKISIRNEEQAQQLVRELQGARYRVSAVQQKTAARQPAPPFITSTLQQEAWRKLKFNGKRTMAIAQQLYEGLPLGKQGPVGLITYMRTDSTNVTSSAISDARSYVKERYGAEFLPPTPRRFAKKVKGAQEAHEAIRPTSIRREPAQVKRYLTPDQLKLYTLIWQRMVASQMAAARIATTTVHIEARPDKGKKRYLFRASSSAVVFPGFLTLYQESKDEEEEDKRKSLPDLAKGEALSLLKLLPEQRFTQPPPQYSEATLIKALEELGIGRPSTYAPTLSLIQERGYVERRNGRLGPTELGTIVSGLLSEHFADIVNVGFTAQMEEKLDQIASGKLEWVPMLQEFYKPFEETIARAATAIPKIAEPTDEICEKCGSPMVIKWGRRGKFLSCSGFPKCKNARSIDATESRTERAPSKVTETTDETCEKCGRPMVVKSGRFGKFLSCSGYGDPDKKKSCKNTKSLQAAIGVKCPNPGCEGTLTEKRTKRGRVFYGCSRYPQCKYATWNKPLPEPCPQCQGLLTASRNSTAKCADCGYEGDAGQEG
jgi:DNA topoisomerase-1